MEKKTYLAPVLSLAAVVYAIACLLLAPVSTALVAAILFFSAQATIVAVSLQFSYFKEYRRAALIACFCAQAFVGVAFLCMKYASVTGMVAVGLVLLAGSLFCLLTYRGNTED